jgi:hypothetical protein
MNGPVCRPASPNRHIRVMTRRAGSADLPLHGGHVPRWLADRMTRLGAVMSEAIVHRYGRDELLRRLANPFWFQSFGAVMGMDWHSSGITTSVIGALKRGLTPVSQELGIHVCGGRGKYSRHTPQELRCSNQRCRKRSSAKMKNWGRCGGWTSNPESSNGRLTVPSSLTSLRKSLIARIPTRAVPFSAGSRRQQIVPIESAPYRNCRADSPDGHEDVQSPFIHKRPSSDHCSRSRRGTAPATSHCELRRSLDHNRAQFTTHAWLRNVGTDPSACFATKSRTPNV